jgi:hypothetical protein
MADSSLDIFFSYAHEDESLCLELIKHFSNLKNRGIISEWYDRKIMPGDEWDKQINLHLTSSRTKIILLLVSSDFMASSYCQSFEVKAAMKRHEEKTACVVPIILRPVDWHESSFHKLKALPKDGIPVTIWDNHDKAFLNIVEGIKEIIDDFEFRTKSSLDGIKINSNIQDSSLGENTLTLNSEQENAKILREIESLLQSSEWKIADEKTSFLLCKFLNHSDDDLISVEEVHLLSCQILEEVDRLWVQNSHGRFGFSVQRKVWASSKEKEDLFYNKIGWKIKGNWLGYNDLCFEIDGPIGHFPTLWTSTKMLGGFRKLFFSHLKKCNV